MEQLDEFMAGGAILGGFSIGTIVVLLGVLAISAAAGISSRRVLFPRLMNLISKGLLPQTLQSTEGLELHLLVYVSLFFHPNYILYVIMY